MLCRSERVAYLGALTLLFSYAEFFLPKVLPFFRLGLSNVVILASLTLDFKSFILLCFVKSVSSSLIAGTLFSVFILISLVQSIFSGLTMYFLRRIFSEKVLSCFGISLAGSGVSALCQLLTASVYLGSGTLNLLGPMILFSVFSGILTAAIFYVFQNELLEKTQSYNDGNLLLKNKQELPECRKNYSVEILKLIFILGFSVCIFIFNNLIFLAASFFSAFVIQKISRRKIFILPHLLTWCFVFFCGFFSSSGKVIFQWNFICVTEGALIQCLQKSLKLSATMALSQSAASVKFPDTTLIGKTLFYFSGFIKKMETAKGNVFTRIKFVLR